MKVTKFYDYNFNNDYVFPGHRHNEYEINIVTEGVLQVISGKNTFNLEKNMCFIFQPNIFHRNNVLSKNVKFYVFHFIDSSLSISFNNVYKLNNENIIILNILKKEILTSNIESEIINLLFKVLVLKLTKTKSLNYKYSAEQKLYENAVNFMEKNINTTLSINIIAQELCVSKSSLKSGFKKVSGQSIMKYFREMKISEAKNYLVKKYKIKDIAEILGYSSASNFSADFKKLTGEYPIKFKAECIEIDNNN